MKQYLKELGSALLSFIALLILLVIGLILVGAVSHQLIWLLVFGWEVLGPG